MFPLEFKNKEFFFPIGIVPETWPSLSTTNLCLTRNEIRIGPNSQLLHSMIFFFCFCFECLLSLVAQMVKNLPAMQESWVRSLSKDSPLEKEMATHSSILDWILAWIQPTGA